MVAVGAGGLGLCAESSTGYPLRYLRFECRCGPRRWRQYQPRQQRQWRHRFSVARQRRRRIAKGSGTSVQEVNQLLKQYAQARKMMKSFSGGMGGMMGKKLGKMKLPAGFPFGDMQ